jgi:protein SCO1/2
MKKIITMVIFYLILSTSLILYFVLNPSPLRLENGIYISKPQLISHFELIDNKGNLFTDLNLRGHWSLLFFGFSSCEMICPLTLQMLNQTYESLPDIKRPEIIFISVDPEHDSLQGLNQFVHQFNQQFIALRGEMSKINAVQKQLHVTVSTAPMSHGTEILLINPEARVQAYFYYPISAKALLLDLNRLIN